METHVARDEQGRVLRWCSHCQSYQPVKYYVAWGIPAGWYCWECGKLVGTSRVVKYE